MGVKKYGKKWKYISVLYFPNKEPTVVKNRFYNHIKRKGIFDALVERGYDKQNIVEELQEKRTEYFRKGMILEQFGEDCVEKANHDILTDMTGSMKHMKSHLS
mmetsp:Transcript_17408/g.15318  ORF Transcript_17408/g.15318 Transcript_17408/m.15318 type:complete len:103 (+) Transcript_17408:205-513(+)